MAATSAQTVDEIPEEHRRKGPAVGQPFPEIRLADQTGAVVDLHAVRAGRPALVIFYRSARW